MENETKDVFDRAVEFIWNDWLKRNRVQGYKTRSVHIEQEKAPPEDGV